jgi:hypothetical protein
MQTIKLTVTPAVPAHEIEVGVVEEKSISTGKAVVVEITDLLNGPTQIRLPRLSSVESYLEKMGMRGATKEELEEYFRGYSGEETAVGATRSFYQDEKREWKYWVFSKNSETRRDGVYSTDAHYYYGPSRYLAIRTG